MTTQVLQSQSHFPSPSSSSASTSTSTSTSITLIHNDVPHHQHYYTPNCPSSVGVQVEEQEQEDQEEGGRGRERDEEREGDQLSLLTLLVTIFRKSLVVGGCSSKRETGFCSRMDIGLPTNVRHVAHVTFDRFDGFLGLPVEFEPEVPRRPPSASASVFGVSTESMQLSFDSRGNSVPTILLLMQRRLYSQGGLKAEGIFRINGENSQEEYIRDQLNRGLVPDGVDVHCLAGLIKAWFRELPKGILDSLPPEQVMQSHSEEECAQLVRTLPPTEAALLDWAINLMADVAQLEHLNKMNARNVAMVFAPNMTQMSDPLTALMYAVQVMNFLKMLIIRTLQEREDSVVENAPCQTEPADENGHDGSSRSVFLDEAKERNEEEEREFSAKEPSLESPSNSTQDGSSITENGEPNFLSSIENIIPDQNGASTDTCNHHEVSSQVKPLADESEENEINGANEVADQDIIFKARAGQSSNTNFKKGLKKAHERAVVRAKGFAQKNKGTNVVSRINSRSERIEAWR